MSDNQWWQTDTNDEVATKPALWRKYADAMDGFDLDPASGAEPSPIADERYTKADDGLSQPWFGTVWLNPPFSEKASWYRKLVNEHWNGDAKAAVALASGDPSTDWFHEWFSTADYLVFLDGRDWYLGQGDSPSFSTQLGLWNPTDDAVEISHTLGTVVTPVTKGDQTDMSEYV